MEQSITTKAHENGRQLKLVIEGKEFAWQEQYITLPEIREIGHLPQEALVYLSVAEPWKDELITDDVKIDLARPEIEHFYVLKALDYTINDVLFKSDRQFIKVAQVRSEGKIPADHDIFLAIKGPWEDELVLDGAWIDLARPGVEHFFSKAISLEIIVNGKPRQWKARTISFAQAVDLVYGPYNETANRVYTVTYKRGPDQNPEGSMVKGETIFVKNKMVINVTATDKS